jgi:hypothetical protein
MGILQKKHLLKVETVDRSKTARLTPKGREAQDKYRERLQAIEEHWNSRYGRDTIEALLHAIENVAFGYPEPYPDGWRASVRKPEILPHFPMVLHRGGFPDGS